MFLREMLIDTFVHMPPLLILEGLSLENAMRRPADGLHSIAEVVAHLDFWQSWFLARVEGRDEPVIANAGLGWPDVTQPDWPALITRFEAGLRRGADIGDDPARIAARLSPPIEFPPLAHYTVRDALAHIAQHNAHHLGQVVILRQMMGLWPPPSGSWTF